MCVYDHVLEDRLKAKKVLTFLEVIFWVNLSCVFRFYTLLVGLSLTYVEQPKCQWHNYFNFMHCKFEMIQVNAKSLPVDELQLYKPVTPTRLTHLLIGSQVTGWHGGMLRWLMERKKDRKIKEINHRGAEDQKADKMERFNDIKRNREVNGDGGS